MSGWGQRTKNGYLLSEVISALQKDIRRGNEELAIVWAVEIATVSRFRLWNRLEVIASEDIGLADNSMTLLVGQLRTQYEDALRRRNGSALIFLSHAVLALCRSPKSNVCNWAVGAVLSRRDNPPIPDYAIDGHTGRGKRRGRGWDFFFEVSTQLHPHVLQAGEADYRDEMWRSRDPFLGDRVTIDDLQGVGRRVRGGHDSDVDRPQVVEQLGLREE